MAKDVRKAESDNFLGKAEEFCLSAMENYQKGRFNASIFDSSQSIILANDALCVFALGRRASKYHREAVRFHVEACAGKESRKEIVTEALEKRGKFGYTQVDCTEKDANLLLVRTKRFIEWVKTKTG
jgi:HEPN domain-containing protein